MNGYDLGFASELRLFTSCLYLNMMILGLCIVRGSQDWEGRASAVAVCGFDVWQRAHDPYRILFSFLFSLLLTRRFVTF